ncbi:MAG TPA: hypothetical protein VF425_08390, partial [Thermoanaerobaculia bacterium]
RTWERDMGGVYKHLYTAVEKPWMSLWKSPDVGAGLRASGQKNKGAGSAPESRKYLDKNRL